nr:S8 family peptidase [Thermoflavimicrobium dichotomicum]
MKLFLPLFFTLTLFFSTSYASGINPASVKSHEIIVKLKHEASLASFGKVVSQNHALGYAVLRVTTSTSINDTIQQLEQLPFVDYAEKNMVFHTTKAPNDPKFSQQYGLKKVRAEQAWTVTKGNANTIIATVDTGVDYKHPDLKEKVIKGKDFVDDDRDPMDENGHGTHCAGIAAAITNNGIGIAGMAPKVKILAVRSLDADGEGYLSDIADGITYAVDQGAKVINLSLGSTDDSRIMREAIQYAVNKGVVVVAAAGNNDSSLPLYPAYYPNVIAVGATDANDEKADFSNYGQWVDIVAPGVDILSTWSDKTYQLESGTSMAAPFVTGVASLLASQGKNGKQIRETLERSADPIPGTGQYWKYGRLNAEKAVKAKK